ncbi:ParA family protein [Paenibacillus popilliae]|uniref:ParA family protein n=1 Tax=Paenibacillus popilliae TaxID=78057 RepID=A0ABY3AVF2_PAEPP|nr:ParA family protein [Paenibacillus sp. SDF0028]TQR46679.1 ParA family protein [Paenibacillus sp. SDF0028]
MATTISFINVKGGVGKTTIILNVAHALQKLGKKILLIDMDLQENLSDKAIADPKSVNHTIYDLLREENLAIDMCIYDTQLEGVQIIPSELEIVRIKKELDPASNPETLFRLRDKIETVKSSYDYILIDLHPDVDMLTTLALIASDKYMIPIKSDADSIKGLKIVDEYVGNLCKINNNLKELGVIITDYDKRTALAKNFYEGMEKLVGERLMKSIIGRNVAITAAAVERKTIFQYDSRQSGCQSFLNLAKEIVQKCEGVELGIRNKEASLHG